MTELKHSDYVVLKHETGLPLGLMNISNDDSIFEYDLKKECENVYGGYDLNHPYVKQFRCPEEEIVCEKVISITINDNKKFDIAKYRDALYDDINKRKK